MRNATDVTILLDRSGSMECVWTDMIGGINSFVKEQRETEGDCAVSFILFDSANSHEIVCENRTVREFAPIDVNAHRPRGGTPLIDAMAKAIICTGDRLRAIPEAHRPDKVIFICVTDGGENCSREFSREQLAQMIETQRKEFNWQFVFLGANFDVFGEASSMGIPMAATAAYHYSPQGVSNTFGMTSKKLSALRCSTADTMDWTAEEQAILSADPNAKS